MKLVISDAHESIEAAPARVTRSRATRSSIATPRSAGSDECTSMSGHSRVRSSFGLAGTYDHWPTRPA